MQPESLLQSDSVFSLHMLMLLPPPLLSCVETVVYDRQALVQQSLQG